MIYENIDYMLRAVANTVFEVVDSTQVYQPVVGQTWVRTTLMPGRSTTMTLGKEHQSEYQGLYRLDIFVEKGSDSIVGNQLVDKFIAAYKGQSILDPTDYNLQDDDIRVYTGEVWREATRYEPVWVNIPVYVSWRAIYQHNTNH